MPRLIALDLGTHAAKVSVYRTNGRRGALEAQYAAPVPQDGSEIPPLAVRLAALDGLIGEHPLWTDGTSAVALAWSCSDAAQHRLTMPFTDRSQIEKTLPFTVEEEVPYDLDDMVLAWRSVRSAPGATDSHVLVTLARREMLGDWLGSLKERGLDPRSVLLDGELLSAWADKDRPVVVIDVGHSHTTVSVVVEGRPEIVRGIDVAGRAFTRSIQEALGCTWAEAERLKHGNEDEPPTQIGGSPAGPDPLPARARQAVDAQMGLLLAEIRSTLVAAEDELGVEIDHVLLTGGGSLLFPFGNYLQSDLGIPVHRVVDPEGDPVDPRFAVGYALNLHQHGGRAEIIDLRQGDLAYQGGVNVLRATVTYGAAAMAFFLAATLVIFVVQYRSLAHEQAEYESQIKDLVAKTLPDVSASSIRDTTAAKALMSERLLAAQERAAVVGRSDAPPTVEELQTLTEAFPDPAETTVEVDDLTITRTTITFTAETDGYEAAANVERALQGSERYSGAVKSEDRKVRDKVSFTITIPLDGAEEEG